MSKKPILLAILDGFGFSKHKEGNAIYNAKTPFFDNLIKNHDHCYIEASGEFVGLPDGQIGNSEVGHLTIGAGRVVYTGLSLINQDIKTGKFDSNPTLLQAIDFAKQNNGNVHIMGLLSPGGVHSNETHIFEMIRIISQNGLKPIIHVFGDGRDVKPQSIISSIQRLEDALKKYGGHIATISGRFYAMDRDRRWERTKLAYDNMLGIGTNYFEDPITYVQSQYDKGIYDEFLEPARRNDSSLNIKDNDAIIHANFRPDRARQMSHLFCGSTVYDEPNEHPFNNIYYAIMMTYEGITPTSILFPTVVVKNTFGEIVSKHGLKQLRIAETEKYAHVTFFFDGGIETEYENEDKILIDSPKVKTYDEIPRMSAVEITDKLIEKMGEYDVIILNFANADMVGHTGKYLPAVEAIEVLDTQLARIDKKIKELGGTMFITADHGNAEDMIDDNGNPVTKHTTNPVLFISNNKNIRIKKPGSLANVAPTVLDFMGLPIPTDMDKPSLLLKK